MVRRILQILLVLSAFTAMADEVDEPEAIDIQGRLANLKARYEDFFARRKAIQEYERGLLIDREEMRKIRESHVRMMEDLRVEFVKNKKVVKVDPRLEQEWLEEEKERREQEEFNRRRYVRYRDRIHLVEAGALRIPGNLEWELEE